MMTTLLLCVLLQQPADGWNVIDGKVTFSQAGCRMEGPAQANSKPIAARPHATYHLSAKVRQLSGTGAYMVALIWRDKAGTVLRVDNDWMGKDLPFKETTHGGGFTAPEGTHDAVISLGVEQKTVCVFNAVELRFEKMVPPYDIDLRWIDSNGKTIDAPLKTVVDPSWLAAPQKARSVGGWKRIEDRFHSAPLSVEPGSLYVVEAGQRTVGFAPVGAARVQVVVTQRSEFEFDTVRFWKITADAPKLDPKQTTVWICPDFRTDPNPLFEPGAPWETAREAIQCYKFHLRVLAQSDRHGKWTRDWRVDLPKAVTALKQAGIGIAVETAGLYGNQPGETGLKSARAELSILNRVVVAGGRIQTLTLDGPISRVIRGGRRKGDGGAAGTLGYLLNESVDHLATYMETVRRAHPEIGIGLIVNFAHWDFEGRESYFGASSYSAGSGHGYDEVLDALLARGVQIRFVHADSPFDYLTAVRSPYNPRWKGERDRLLALEAYCRRKGLGFGLICNTEARQRGSDREFYEQTLQSLQLYRAFGGRPDTFIVESWFEFPRRLLPESGTYTFTRLARDFATQVRGLYRGD